MSRRADAGAIGARRARADAMLTSPSCRPPARRHLFVPAYTQHRRREAVIARRCLTFLAALVLGAAVQPAAAADAADYPQRPVRWVVPFAPGASNDIIARMLAQKLTESLGQQFIIDNRGGAGGLVGGEIVAKSAPDGYTLLSANPGPNIHHILLRRKPPYQFEDFTPIVFFGYAPLIIVANAKFGPSNARELVDYARAHPGKLSWASSGFGSSLHIGLELFKAATKVQVTHVPYKGTAPAFLDIVSGQVNVMYTTSVSAETHLKAGRLKALGIAARKRQGVLPTLPTLEEQGIRNAEAIVWFGLAGPARLPRPIVQKLNAEINRALGLPDVKQRLDQLGLEVGGGSPEDFTKFMNSEASRLRELIKAGAVEVE
jgi:tripartite-type tricarboxylate transporter receptor subunit TctC